MSIEFRNAKGVPMPITDYSQAVIGPADAKLVFVSGQVALNERGELVGEGDAVRQTEQILARRDRLRRRDQRIEEER